MCKDIPEYLTMRLSYPSPSSLCIVHDILFRETVAGYLIITCFDYFFVLDREDLQFRRRPIFVHSSEPSRSNHY